MRKKYIAYMFILIVFSVFFLNSCKKDQREKIVYDKADILTTAEESEIEAEAKKYFEDSFSAIYVVTDDSENYENYQGDDFLNEESIQQGDIIVIIVTDNESRNYNIYEYGKSYKKISYDEHFEILDDPGVYKNIKSGNYKAGIIRCMELCAYECRTDFFAIFAIAIAVAILITGIFVGCIIYSYNKKIRSEKYPLDRYAKLDLKVSNDSFVGKFVTVSVIKSSSFHGNRSGGRSRGEGFKGGRRGR